MILAEQEQAEGMEKFMIKTKQNLKSKNVRPSRKAERQTENKRSGKVHRKTKQKTYYYESTYEPPKETECPFWNINEDAIYC